MSSAIVTFSDEELVAALRDAEVCRRKLEAESQQLVAAALQRGLASKFNARSLPAMLTQLLRISPGEARARVSAAEFLQPRTTITGEVLEPLYPQVAAAQAAGEISAHHAKVVIDVIEKLPDLAKAGHEDEREQTMVGYAREFDPTQLAKLGRRLEAILDPDGVLNDVEHAHKTRGLEIHRRPNGSARIEGDLDVEAAEYLVAALAAYTKPCGEDDTRTPSQRRHDGLMEIVKTAMRGGQLPTTSGVTTAVMLTISESDDLVATGSGTLIPKAEAKRWIGEDTRFYATLIDRAKRPVSYSPKAARLFTETQRLVMAARDGGCIAYGCTAPPSQTEAHHILDWSKGGPTSIENGCLLCPFHHRHMLDQGWRIVMIDGIPNTVAPNWIDPTQTPRRNTAHHPWQQNPRRR